MPPFKEALIGAGFGFFGLTGLHRRLAPVTRGLGAILMLHHVRPFTARMAAPDVFAPNRLLEIEPAFLDAVLGRVRSLGYEIITMDAVVERLAAPSSVDRPPFVAITFDDGYRDLVTHALPILERHDAPFTAFITSGFGDRAARLWWLELEDAVASLDRIDTTVDGAPVHLPSATAAQKRAAFRWLYGALRRRPEAEMLATIAALCRAAGLATGTHAADLCLDWDGIRDLARHTLCTIGAHTVSHPMLAKHDVAVVQRELVEGRQAIETAIGLPVRHLAYPVGDPSAAGPRDFALAAELGFKSAVTTRPGMIVPGHGNSPCALPRLSLNGNWQDLSSFEILLSGLPFALWNKGRLAA